MKKSTLLIIIAIIVVIAAGAWYLASNQKPVSKKASVYKASCEKLGGKWSAGPEADSESLITSSCLIKGENYSFGSWQMLPEMEKSCLKYQGKWLAGVDFKCQINGEVYAGNWESVFALKDSCLAQKGQWLGGQNLACQIDGETYNNGDWQKIADLKASCEQYGGEWKGGAKFECISDGESFNNGQWVRASETDAMGEKCTAAGGKWLDEYRECEGLGVDWCIKIEQELEKVKGLMFDECASACRHNNNSDNCTLQCVPVCQLNL